MSERTEDDVCLLCHTEKATKKNSHLLPASIIATMVGARNKEEAYTIAPTSSTPIKVFYGRENLNNKDTTQRTNDNVVDYFFCPSCENRFAIIENEINPILVNKIRDTNQRSNFPIVELDSGVNYINCIRVNSNIFRLYIFSLIWRMCLKYKILYGQDFLASSSEVDWLRDVLNDCLEDSLEETIAKSDTTEIEKLSFVSCACLEEYNRASNAGMLHPNYRYPYCLLCNDYIFLFNFNESKLNDKEPLIKLHDFKVDKRVINKTGIVKIVLSNLTNWKLFLDSMWQQFAVNTTNEYVTLLSDKLKINYNVAGAILNKKAIEIEKKTGKGFFDCFVEAFQFYYN